MTVVDWSRWQFALTAIYHWLFVPLTLGLSVIVGVMETAYVRTGSESWLKATKFWMSLFGINFAIGVATGLILEFEFGTNWSNYSWFCWRHLRCASRHRGDIGFLYGIHVRCRDVFRLGAREQAFPSCLHVAYGRRSLDFRALDSRGQRVDAVSGRNGVRPCADAQCDG